MCIELVRLCVCVCVCAGHGGAAQASSSSFVDLSTARQVPGPANPRAHTRHCGRGRGGDACRCQGRSRRGGRCRGLHVRHDQSAKHGRSGRVCRTNTAWHWYLLSSLFVPIPHSLMSSLPLRLVIYVIFSLTSSSLTISQGTQTSVDNTDKENSSVFRVIRMHWLPSSRAGSTTVHQQKSFSS